LNILKNNKSDYIIIYEIFWILINITLFSTSDLNFDYYNKFVENDFINLYNYYLHEKTFPQEILIIIYNFLNNITVFHKEIRIKLIQTDFILNSLKYLKDNNIIKKNILIENLYKLFKNISKNYNDYNEDLARKFFNIFIEIFILDIDKNNILLLICLYGLKNISKIQNENIQILFIKCDILNILINNKIENDESNLIKLKILNNLIINNIKQVNNYITCDNKILILITEILKEIIFCTGEFRIKMFEKILYCLNNLTLLDFNIANNIISNFLLINFINERIIYESDLKIRIIAVKILHNILTILSTDIPINIIFKFIPSLIFILKNERNEEIIKESFNCIGKIIQISIYLDGKNNENNNIQSIRNNLNNLELYDILNRDLIINQIDNQQIKEIKNFLKILN